MPVATAQPRWSIYAEVAPRRSRIDCSWNAVNISRSGVFVAGQPLLKAGSKLDVVLHLPGVYGPSIEVNGRVEVVWNRPPRDASRDRPSGMGCRFIQLEPRSRVELDAFIDELQDHRPADSGGLRTRLPPPPPKEALAENEVIALEEIAETSQSPSIVESFKGEPIPAPRRPRTYDTSQKLGHYRILRTLGAGGMGEVFLAEHELIGRRVAIKRLHDQFSRDPQAVRRFFDEAKLINQISHPNIVEVTDLVCSRNDLYYVMELIEGSTLLDEIKRERGLALPRVLWIGAQLADALHSVHEAGIIHRDLKPDNVLLTLREGKRDVVKLLDFGIAKLRVAHEQNRHTMAGFVVGTPGYMSPEQILSQPLDHRTDIYGLGVLLHEMVSGKRAFSGKSFGELMLKQSSQIPAPPTPPRGPDLPPSLKTLIIRCLELSPDDRPQSAAQVRDRLREILSSTA